MTFVGATSAGDFIDQVTVTVPVGVRDGDRMLLLVTSNDNQGITPPSGWSLVMEEIFEGNSVGNWVYEREAAAEPADYAITFGAAHWQFAVLAAWRGHGPVSAVEHVNDSGVTTLDLPSVNAAAGDVLVAFGFNWEDTPKSWSPSGLSEVANLSRAIIASHETPPAGPTEVYTLTADTAGVMGATALLLPALPTVHPVPTPARGEIDPVPEWRYHAMRWTGEWLHRELPLANVQLTPTLSGPYQLQAEIDPVYAELVADDGLPILQERSTLIFAEAAGHLRGGGLVTRTAALGPKLDIEVAGFSSYATDQPLTSTLTWGGSEDGTTGHGVDPLTVVRALWDHLQAQPDGALGVTYTPTSTDYSLGEWHNARALDEDGSLGDDAKQIEEPPPPIDKVWTAKDEKPVAAKGKTVWWRYRLAWWDGVDIGRHIEELAKQVPFDYREHYRWGDDDHESVVMELQFGYPRLGRRRDDLRFVQDENLSQVVSVSRDADEWVNEVIALGSGEGSKQLRQTARVRDGRLRTARTLDRSEISNKASLKAQAEDDLLRTYHLDDITRFTVTDHPHAPIGSFEPGDDVLVECEAWGRWVRLWVRILSFTFAPDDPAGEIEITCSRSDRFRYGGAI